MPMEVMLVVVVVGLKRAVVVGRGGVKIGMNGRVHAAARTAGRHVTNEDTTGLALVVGGRRS